VCPRVRAGKTPIMSIKPESVHQRVPTFLGSPIDVDELERWAWVHS
jgi:fructose-1,6-bisphosphatase